MPVYEYACNGCSQSFELLVRKSKATPECPHCKSDDLRRKLSSFSSQMNGASSDSFCSPQPSGGCCGGGACLH